MSSVPALKSEKAEFLDLTINALVDDDGNQFFSPRHVCDELGLGWSSQLKRLKRDPIFVERMVQMTTLAADGKKRKVTLLPMWLLAGWLMGLSVNKVRPELKEQMLKFKLEAKAVLNAWFMKGGREAVMDSKNDSFDMGAAVKETLEKELARFQAVLDQYAIDIN